MSKLNYVLTFVRCLMNVYCKTFTIIFIIKLMELSLKIEMSHFIVSDIVMTRRVVTKTRSQNPPLQYKLDINMLIRKLHS